MRSRIGGRLATAPAASAAGALGHVPRRAAVRDSVGVEREGGVRVWRAEVPGGCLCMSGTTTGYAVDPVGEYVVGVMVAGAMQVRRGRERIVFGPRDVCTWDPSAAHRGTPYGCRSWEARLVVLESPVLERILSGPEPLAADLRFPSPLVRDERLARRFVELHRTLEAPSWALEREALLADWLREVGDGPAELDDRRHAARRDPALRRACELLGEELARNVTLDELERAAGVSRHRLSRLFRAAYGVPPHRFQLATGSGSPGACSSAASTSRRSRRRPGSSIRATCTGTSGARSA
jgi:AraC-like protein